ncbi:MAG: hypothetical protein DI605_19730 [Sphingomonas sp.]|nr:MAG: hypothetical protein DI605_19730 [Sphingomonas sp.]
MPPLFLQDHIRNIFERARPGRPVVRADDLVALRIETQNLTIVPGTPPRLRKTARGAATLILHFPPQSFAEETFFERKPAKLDDAPKPDDTPKPGEKKKPEPVGGGSETLKPPPVRARIAGESRLAFAVPDGFDIEYSLAAVLAAARTLEPRVAAAAKPRANPPSRFHFEELLNLKAVRELPIKRRAAMAGAVASTLRIGVAAGDVTTVRARQLSAGAGFSIDILRPGSITAVPGVRIVAAKPALPGAAVTAIEMPWRLILSPHSGTRWRHSPDAVTSAATQRTELWHSRLVAPRADGTEIEPPYPDAGRTTRAVWALSGKGGEAADKPMTSNWIDSDQLPSTAANPFRTTLDNFDRYQIAQLSSNFSVSGYTPEPLDTNMMMLTSLGGWLDSRGAWDPPGLSVEEWVHRATMGRDHYVRVVYRGFLFPFGHRVSLIKVSERKFHNGNATAEQMPGNVAYLRQRFFIVIRERERAYDDTAFLNATSSSGIRLARQFPFSRIKILTETTPDLDDPGIAPSSIGGRGQKMFWPHVGGKPFRFQCAGTDLDGRRVTFDLPMIFVDNTLAAPRKLNSSTKKLVPNFGVAEDAGIAAAIAYGNATDDYNCAYLDWQRIALAPSLKAGDTSVQADRVEFGGFVEKNSASLKAVSDNLNRPIWVPKVVQVAARIGPIAHLSGSQEPHSLTFNQQFLRAGFDPAPSGNRGEVFVDVAAGSGPNLDFSSQGDKSGGFMQPNIKPAALSRLAGPIMSDPAKFITGEMPAGAGFPTSISDLPLPLLFGCIPLGELIEAVADLAGSPDKVPKFVSEASTKIESFVNGLVRLYEFVTDLASNPAGIADAAMAAFKATLEDLIDQAKTYAAAQVGPVVAAAQDVIAKVEEIAGKLQALIAKTIDAAATAPQLADLPGSIGEARTAIADMKAKANASVGGVSLPSGFRQSVLNAADKLDALLVDLQQLQAIITAGKGLWDALSGIVGDPSVLSNLFSNPAALKAKIEALIAAIGPFKTALAGFKLLDGAPRKAVLDALTAVEQVLGGVDDLLQLVEMLTGDELTIRFDWTPEIASWWLPGANKATDDPIFRANNKRGLMVAVEAKVKKNGSSSPKISVVCGLKHFDLVLIAPASFMELNFEKIEFSIDSAAKMDVDVLLSDIKFVGPLSFVETLKDVIPLDGFSDPPYLDITPQGIDAGFDVSLPSITCGVLNIANVSLGAGFTVPFIGQPLSVRFNFCRRDQPFLLTVYIFGGGGFFGVTIDPHGVQILEASFEFGAAFSIDFGVASGGVHVMAGIYYRMEGNDASLTGYFRLGGHVDVLGLITASIELYLELRYEFSSGKCVGKAELTIEISLFIFSGSVTITCEKKFAGSNGDPSLRQMLGYEPAVPLAQELQQIDESADYAWRDHIEAFA